MRFALGSNVTFSAERKLQKWVTLDHELYPRNPTAPQTQLFVSQVLLLTTPLPKGSSPAKSGDSEGQPPRPPRTSLSTLRFVPVPAWRKDPSYRGRASSTPEAAARGPLGQRYPWQLSLGMGILRWPGEPGSRTYGVQRAPSVPRCLLRLPQLAAY